jgi:hypothetical protein
VGLSIAALAPRPLLQCYRTTVAVCWLDHLWHTVGCGCGQGGSSKAVRGGRQRLLRVSCAGGAARCCCGAGSLCVRGVAESMLQLDNAGGSCTHFLRTGLALAHASSNSDGSPSTAHDQTH